MVSHSSTARAQPATGSIANSGVVRVFLDTGSRQTVPLSKHTSSPATIIQCSTNPEHSSTRCEGVEPSRRQLSILEANNKSARLAGHCSPMPNDDSLVSDHFADVPSWHLAAVSTSYKDLCPIMPISRVWRIAQHQRTTWEKAATFLAIYSTVTLCPISSVSNIIPFRYICGFETPLHVATMRPCAAPTTAYSAGPYSKLPKTSSPSSRRKRPTQYINLSRNSVVSRRLNCPSSAPLVDSAG
jgi:hypothetical protein